MARSADTTVLQTRQYADLLAEARAIKGVSLGQDAWRRLRKNRTAMASLVFLVLLSAAALLTPLLPLQSPIKQDPRGRQFLPPERTTVAIGLAETFASVNDNIARLGSQLADAAPAEQKRLRGQIDEQHDIYRRRVDNLWHNPGPLDRVLIRVRLAVFGDWCVPSICGTDHLGRDVLARLMWGARVSLMVGLVATLVSLVIGVSYGATAGYLGGWVDNLMMRLVDVLYSIPFIFVVIFLITFLSEETIKRKYLDPYHIDRIMLFYIVIGAIYWLTMARVVRGQVISLKNEQFIEAARAVGAGRLRIIFRHLVPNVLSIVIVYLTLTIPAVMLFESFLSFLGLGVSPPDVSWGLLASEGIQVITSIKIFWWLVLFPDLALALTLFALSFLGDGLRDALDPRMKNR